jgi:hypothetical protein
MSYRAGRSACPLINEHTALADTNCSTLCRVRSRMTSCCDTADPGALLREHALARAGLAARDPYAIIPAMSDLPPRLRAMVPTAPLPPIAPADEKLRCERCHAEMFRLNAVWRCSSRGFTTVSRDS